MQALTKNDMKPSRAPCFFSKASFGRWRSAITLVLSTSLKVVSMAAVFCASLSRLAMGRRRRVVRTRSSRSARARGPAGAAGLAAGAAGAGIDERAAITSALVARPSLPVGWIADGATPVSSTSLRVAGPEAAMLALAAAGAATGTTGGGLGAGLGAAVAAAGLAAAAPPTPASMWHSTPPTWTVAPSSTARSTMVPATVAFTSTVTLSVSSSHRGWSMATVSPAFTSHLATVASVTDSPSAGTLISTAISKSSSTPSSDRQRAVDQIGLFLDMGARRAGRRRGRLGPADIDRPRCLDVEAGERALDAAIDEMPAAHVLRLLLAPHHLGIGKLRQPHAQPAEREGIQLFDAHDGDVVDLALSALGQEVEVDLARAQDDAPDLGAVDELIGLGQDAPERRARPEILQPRHRILVAQQRLRRHHHQRLAERTARLAAQRMEIVGRRRRHDDLPVVLGRELQIAFETGRAVLRSLPLVAVRQQHHQAVHAQPLALARADELVDDDLRAVGEVAELRLPHHQRIGFGRRVAVLEAQHARLF